MKSTAVRQSAEGQKCSLRISCTCRGSDTSTTIFAHAPSQFKGMGNKSPDFFGAYACLACHDLVDGRGHEWKAYSALEITGTWLRGICETQVILVEKGLLGFKADKQQPKDFTKKVENHGLYRKKNNE